MHQFVRKVTTEIFFRKGWRLKIDHFEFRSSPFSSSVSTNDTQSACELKFSAEGLVVIKEAPSFVASCWPFSDSFTMDPFKIVVAARRRLRDFVTGSRPSVSPVQIYLISVNYLIWIISRHGITGSQYQQPHPPYQEKLQLLFGMDLTPPFLFYPWPKFS